jgi:hypothetical protein
MTRAPSEAAMTLMLKLDHNGIAAWHKCAASNPDDALSELEHRGVYDFERGDVLKKVMPVSETEHGYRIEDDSDAY